METDIKKALAYLCITGMAKVFIDGVTAKAMNNILDRERARSDEYARSFMESLHKETAGAEEPKTKTQELKEKWGIK